MSVIFRSFEVRVLFNNFGGPNKALQLTPSRGASIFYDGLFLEMLGLSLLFFDLLRGKRLTDSSTAIRTIQDDLDTSTRDLLINTNKHIFLLGDFIGKFLVIGDLPSEMRRAIAEEFLRAKESLPNSEMIQKAVASNMVASSEILKNFDKYTKDADRLRRFAAFGVLFVACGALTQFADLLL